MTSTKDITEADLFAAGRRVLRAGLHLLQNGYGRLGLLPYTAPSGCFWRCEFHPIGKPSKTLYRYSTADGFKYLAGQCGGSVPKNISPARLGEAIMVGVPWEVRDACKGDLDVDTAVWTWELERHLERGCLPSALQDYTEDFSVWQILSPGSVSLHQPVMSPQPGYVVPGREPSWQDSPAWRQGLSRWSALAARKVVCLDEAAIASLAEDAPLVREFCAAMKEVEAGDASCLIKAFLGRLTNGEVSEVAVSQGGTRA